MNYNEEKVIVRVIESSTNNVYRVLSAWDKNNLFINIISSSKTWVGEMNEEQLTEMAKQHQLDLNRYKTDLLKYLHKTDASEVIYEINNNTFTIRKPVKAIKLNYFAISLKTVNFNDTINNVLDFLIDDNMKLKQKMLDLDTIKKEAESIKDQSLKKLEEYVDLHKENEEKLYSSFVLLLNEKKCQIQHLNSTLERISLQKGADVMEETFTSDEESIEESATPPRRIECISDSESDGDESAKVNATEKPSTSKSTMDILFRDDSNSPPPVAIKKLKTNTSEIKIVENPTTKVAEDVIKVDVKKTSAIASVDEESPTLEFSTQDLLNRL